MDGLPEAGWYADAGLAGSERWWDGRAWTEYVRPASETAAAPRGTGRQATVVLVLGVAGLVAAFVPVVSFLAFFACGAAVVLGVVSLRRLNPERAKVLVGLVLGAVGVVVSIILSTVLVVALVAGTSGVRRLPVPVPSSTKSSVPKPSGTPTPKPTSTSMPTSTSKPTSTPRPTASPKPTNTTTPIPKPTGITPPKPTATASPN